MWEILQRILIWFSTPGNRLIYLGGAARHYMPFMEHLTTCIYGSQWFTVLHVKPPTDQLSGNEGCHLYLCRLWTAKVLLLKMKNTRPEGSGGWVCTGNLQKRMELKTSCWHTLKAVVLGLGKKKKKDPDLEMRLKCIRNQQRLARICDSMLCWTLLMSVRLNLNAFQVSC